MSSDVSVPWCSSGGGRGTVGLTVNLFSLLTEEKLNGDVRVSGVEGAVLGGKMGDCGERVEFTDGR